MLLPPNIFDNPLSKSSTSSPFKGDENCQLDNFSIFSSSNSFIILSMFHFLLKAAGRRSLCRAIFKSEGQKDFAMRFLNLRAEGFESERKRDAPRKSLQSADKCANRLFSASSVYPCARKMPFGWGQWTWKRYRRSGRRQLRAWISPKLNRKAPAIFGRFRVLSKKIM